MRRLDHYDTILVPWYIESEYEELLALVGQDPRLPKTYPEWKRQATIATEWLLARGKAVQLITGHPRDYLEWLGTNGRTNSAVARLRYLKWLAVQNGKTAAVLPYPMKVLAALG